MTNWYQYGSGVWQGLGWWNSANALEAVIDYSNLRTMDNINAIIYDVYDNNVKQKSGNFLDEYYDDEGWWALAWLKAYDKTKDTKFLETSEFLFEDMTGGWDQVVANGGLWWTKARQNKNAIVNELFITLGAKLYLRTLNSSYLNWAERCWVWFENTGMQGPDGLINDGVDLSTGKNNGYPTWTYNQGVILGGLFDLYQITKNASYLGRAEQIASSAMNLLVNDQGVLTEPCEAYQTGCGADGSQFKGIFVRYLSYLYQKELGLSPGLRNPNFLSTCQAFFAKQATSIWNNDRDKSQNTLGLHWAGPYLEADASTQSSALDALNAAIVI
jgi:predicted alpha-1,6-mannanase (GH76 family)